MTKRYEFDWQIPVPAPLLQVSLSYILQLYLNPVAPQQYHYYNEAPQQYDEVNDDGYSNEFSYDQNKRSVIRRSRFTETEECHCICERCFDGREKPCCDEFCSYCAPPQDIPMGNIDQYGALPPAEQKVVFVPFPYPIIVPDEITTPSLTTLANTTPRPTTTTAKPTKTTTKMTTPTSKPTPTTTKMTIPTSKPAQTTTKMTTATSKPAQTTTKMTTTTSKPTPTTTKITTTTSKPTPTTTKMTTPISPNNHPSSEPRKMSTWRRANDLEYDILTRHRQLMQLNPVVMRHRPTWVPKYGIVPNPYLIN